MMVNWKFLPSSPSAEEQLERAAHDAMHLAIFLQAGLTSQRVKELVQPDLKDKEGPAWLLSHVWETAHSHGIAPAEALSAYAKVFEESAQLLRHAQALQAGPRVARRIILLLPLLALGGAALLGNNAVGFLFLEPMGWVLLVLAGTLTWVAHTWTKQLTEKATQADWRTGAEADLCALYLSAGYPVDKARNLSRLIFTSVQLGRNIPDPIVGLEIEKILTLSMAEGIPAATLLRALATRQRHQAQTQLRIQVEELSVKLIIPLGVCILPAFILVGVVPLAIAMLSSTALS